MSRSKGPVPSTSYSSSALHIPSITLSSRASICSFSHPTSRPDWAAVSHLFADGLYELQVLHLDHASEPTASDMAIQAALAVNLPISAVPSVLTEADSGSMFAPKVGCGLGYRGSVASTVSRARSTSRRPHPYDGLHISTSLISPNESTTTSPITGPNTPSHDFITPDITTTLIANRRIRKVEKRMHIMETSPQNYIWNESSGVCSSMTLEMAGDGVSRPTSRSRSTSRRSERHNSQSRSRSRSRLHSSATSILRRSVEMVRSNSVRSVATTSEKLEVEVIARKSCESAQNLHVPSSSSSGHYSSPTSHAAPNPIGMDSPHSRLRRARFIPTARTAIPEEGEEEQPVECERLPTPHEVEVEDGNDVSRTDGTPILVPSTSRLKRLSRTTSLRQLFNFRPKFSSSSRSTPSSSTPSSSRPSINLPSYPTPRSDSPERQSAAMRHARSQSQTTTFSFSPSVATTIDTSTTATPRPHRAPRRRQRISQILTAPFRASSTPPSTHIDRATETKIDLEKTAEKIEEREKHKHRLSRFRSSIFIRSTDDQEANGKRLSKSKSAMILTGSRDVGRLSEGAQNSPDVSVTTSSALVAPPVPPPPPPVSISTSPTSILAPVVLIQPSDLDPLSFLHVQHRAITDRFDKFVGLQRSNLAEFKSRAMKRVVHAHLVARVPLMEELKQYGKAEKGYVEFCQKMQQSGLVAGSSQSGLSPNTGQQGDDDEGQGVGLGVSFDSGIAFVGTECDTKDKESLEPNAEDGLSRASICENLLSIVIPPSPKPSPTSSVFSTGTRNEDSTAQTTPFPSPHTSNPPPPPVKQEASRLIVVTTGAGCGGSPIPILIPQPPSSSAHSAALLRLSRLDHSMATQACRLIEAFDGYGQKLDDVFSYRAERIAGRWLLESRVVIWQWLSSERERWAKVLAGQEMGEYDTIAYGILADEDVVNRLDVSNVVVPLGWGWRGF